MIPDTTAPTAPTLSANGTTSTTTTLSWSGATDANGVTDYNVYQGATLLGATLSTTYPVTGLTPLTTYSFTVKAKDAAGNLSVASNSVTVTTLTPIYCPSLGNSVADERIGNVTVGTINNTSVGGTGYTDFTAISTDMQRGSTQTISITPTWTSTVYNEVYAVFIDYNRYGDFSDIGETVWTKAASVTTPVTGTFVIPAGASLGATRMRVALKFNAIPTACETFQYGQVEDYTVMLTETPAVSVIAVKLNIEGYYDPEAHALRTVKALQGIGSSSTDVADITLELRNPTTLAVAATTNAVLHTDGTAVAVIR